MRGPLQTVLALASIVFLSCQGEDLTDFDRANMVRVEGGIFVMGTDASPNASPRHQVTLSTYLIGRTELTGDQYAAVMGRDPSYDPGKNLPVEWVSWFDASLFCNALSLSQGLQPAYLVDETKRTVTLIEGSRGYRLPTEAEWEFAAIGGRLSKGYLFSGSNDFHDVAWDGTNSGGRVHEVATKKPNELGLYDMDGNVWEWCFDGYQDYTEESQVNPQGLGSNNYKVVRGGNWDWLVGQFGTRYRFTRDFDHRNKYYGLRIARSL